jgi:integrase
MRKLKPPAVPDQPVPVIGESQLQRLLGVCAGKDFDARRDTALIMLLVDAGPRRAELVGMCLDAVDFEYDVIRVVSSSTVMHSK